MCSWVHNLAVAYTGFEPIRYRAWMRLGKTLGKAEGSLGVVVADIRVIPTIPRTDTVLLFVNNGNLAQRPTWLLAIFCGGFVKNAIF